MNITNPNNLPQCLVDAVTPDQGRGLDPDRMSITDLINPPMMRHLRQKHWHEMEERVDDRVWLMLGQAFHAWIDSHTPEHSEIRVEYEYAGYTIVGVVDLIEGKTVVDYKVTSAYSFLLGEKPEWEQQLNCYAWLLAQKGRQIDSLKIIAILRDWQLSKTYKDFAYPKSAILEHSVNLWPPHIQEKYVQDRIWIHKTRNGEVSKCTPAEKWHKDDTFAVKVPGVKTAKRVLNCEKDALDWGEKNLKVKFEVEHRKGEDSRCKNYCSVRNFCLENIYRGSNEQTTDESDG